MINDWIAFWAGIDKEKTAVISNGKEYSYGDINTVAHKLAHFLEDKYGIAHSDRICILSENRIEYIYLFSFAQKSGAVLVPLNYRLTKFELQQLLEDADPTLIIYEKQFSKLLPLNDGRNYIEIESLVQLAGNYNTSTSDVNKISGDDPIFILYTSGSTGRPKGVLYTHRMLLWNSINTSVCLGLSPDTRTLVCMPPFHTGGWNVLLTPVLHHGGSCILMKKFDAPEVLMLLSNYKCSQFMGVPTMLKMMSEEKSFNSTELASLKYLLVGGEPMPIPLIKKYHEKGIMIRQGFGMTEAGPNLTSLHHNEALRKIGSIGKPNMFVEISLRDPQNKAVGINTKGELCIKGPVVTPGYWNNDEATNRAIEDGWLHSGDVALQDEEGFLYIVDRIKNMFISGGENVYPLEIERVLNQHPGISEVAVIGVPDEKWGEVGKAFIVKNSGQVNESLLKSYCLDRLSKYKIPKEFTFVDSLPKNAAGKIDRLHLKDM